MFLYILKRLLLAALTLLVILLVSYLMLRAAPGDPTRSSLFGSDSNAGTVDTKSGLASNLALREELHLDRPVLTGFSLWLKAIITRGDFGKSATVDPGRPVLAVIGERLPATLKLNIAAIIVTYIFAIFLGVHGAVNANSRIDEASSFALFVLYSMPVMWVGLMLQALFCEGGIWNIFPLQGLEVPDSGKYSIWRLQWEIARHYILPVFCLSYAGLAGLSRYTRNSMLEVLNANYIRTARAKGVPEYRVIWEHAFSNSLITLITLFGGLLPSLIAGSIIIEYIFNIPGMGNLSLLALSSRDYPLQMALFFFSGLLTLIGILLADLLYMVCDPRIELTK